MGGGFAFISLPAMFCRAARRPLFRHGLSPLLSFLRRPHQRHPAFWRAWWPFSPEEFHLSRARAAIGPVGAHWHFAFTSAGYSLSQFAGGASTCPWFDFKTGCRCSPMNAVMEKFTDNPMILWGR